MTNHDSKSFSTDLSNHQSVDAQVEAVGNPLVRHVLNQVLAEAATPTRLGSGFGENVPQVRI